MLKYLCTIAAVLFVVLNASSAIAKEPTDAELAKMAVDDLVPRAYRAQVLLKQAESELRRLKNEAQETKILEHKVETKGEREVRIDEESKLRNAGIIASGLGGLAAFMLSLWAFFKNRRESLERKAGCITKIVKETIAYIEKLSANLIKAGKPPLSSEEKLKQGVAYAKELAKKSEYKILGGSKVAWDKRIDAALAKNAV